MNTMEQLKKQCENIAIEITEGIIVSENNIDLYDGLEPGDNITAWDYLVDAFDIRYTISSDLVYLSGQVAVALGGPNIYINTANNEVEGYWGSDRVSIPFIDNMGIDEYLEENFNNKLDCNCN